MQDNYDTDVVIIGAGPVGLAAAMALDSRGIRCTIVEERRYLQPPSVKSNHVSARTMERFRSFGVAQKVRGAGLPGDYPNDISFRLTLTGQEIGRIPIPGRNDRYVSRVGPDTAWSTPEPPHRINQTFLEPVLLEHVAGLPNVVILNQTRFVRYEQDDTSITARIRSADGTGERALRARFLIGADGSRSAIRKQMGVSLIGDAVIQNVMSTCIRARGLYDRMPGDPAWAYYTFNTRRNGHVYAIDGDDVFLVHNQLTPEEAATGSVDRVQSIRAILGVNEAFEFDILSEEDWVARRLVAERFRDGRVFIAGDAAHLWVPYAGYGMNAGIADAFNLAWMLAAELEGWAGSRMLDVYEAERLPITAQVSRFAMSHAEKIIHSRTALPPEIEDDTPEGRSARARIGREASALNTQQFAAEGLNFGYVYDASPVIAYDGEAAPAYTMSTYTPSTVPGCRLPHFWTADGSSIYDRLGPAYTLLRFDPDSEVDEMLEAAQKVGLPLELVDVAFGSAPSSIREVLVVCRADQHIAWRGMAMPSDVEGLVEVLRGAGNSVVPAPDASRADISAHSRVAV